MKGASAGLGPKPGLGPKREQAPPEMGSDGLFETEAAFPGVVAAALWARRSSFQRTTGSHERVAIK